MFSRGSGACWQGADDSSGREFVKWSTCRQVARAPTAPAGHSRPSDRLCQFGSRSPKDEVYSRLWPTPLPASGGRAPWNSFSPALPTAGPHHLARDTASASGGAPATGAGVPRKNLCLRVSYT